MMDRGNTMVNRLIRYTYDSTGVISSSGWVGPDTTLRLTSSSAGLATGTGTDEARARTSAASAASALFVIVASAASMSGFSLHYFILAT